MKAKAVTHLSVLTDALNQERFIGRTNPSVLEQDLPMGGVDILVAGDAPIVRAPDNISLYRWH